MKTSSELKTAIINSEYASFWLKDAIQRLAERDPVDALKDAKFLELYCSTRLREVDNGIY